MNQAESEQRNINNDLVEIDLREYLYLLWRKKWIIIILVILALVASYIFSKQMTKIYSTSTMIMINKSGSSENIFDEQFSINIEDKNEVERYMYILESRKILNNVIKKCNLTNEDDELISTNSLKNMVAIRRKGETDLLEITVNYSDPVMAKNIVENIVDEFKKEIKDINRANLNSASQFVDEQIVDIKSSLADLEEKILKYKKENDIIDPQQQSRNQLNQLSSLEMSKVESGLELEQALASLKEINEYLEKKGFTSQEIDKIVNSDYENNNPIFTNLFNEKVDLEKQIVESKIKMDNYAKGISSVNEELDKFPEKNLELSRLEREADVTENLYLLLKERQEEISIQTAMKSIDIVVLDNATINRNPIKPNITLNMAIAVLLAIFIAVFIIFIFEFMDRTIQNEKDIEKATGLSVLAIIPDADGDNKNDEYGYGYGYKEDDND